jgi:hypothetical protein
MNAFTGFLCRIASSKRKATTGENSIKSRISASVNAVKAGHYRLKYDAFFEERSLIPAGHYYEIGYEDLERDPLGELRRLYEGLALPSFAEVEPALTKYVASIAGYKKNTFPDLPLELKCRIAESWRRCFDEWNYST